MPDEVQEIDKEEIAEKAKQECDTQIAEWSGHDVAEWWQRWFGKLGHKRLGRILRDVKKPEVKS